MTSSTDLQVYAIFISSKDKIIVLHKGTYLGTPNTLVIATFELTAVQPKVKYHKTWTSAMSASDVMTIGAFASETVWYTAYHGNNLKLSMLSSPIVSPFIEVFIIISYQSTSCAILQPI